MTGATATTLFTSAVADEGAFVERRLREHRLFNAIARYADSACADMLPYMRSKFSDEVSDAAVYVHSVMAMEPYKYMLAFAKARARGEVYRDAVRLGLAALTHGELLPVNVDLGDIAANISAYDRYVQDHRSNAYSDHVNRAVTIEALYALQAYEGYGRRYDLLMSGSMLARDRFKCDLLDHIDHEQGMDAVRHVSMQCPEIDFLREFSGFLDRQITASHYIETMAVIALREQVQQTEEAVIERLAAEGAYRDLCADLKALVKDTRRTGRYTEVFMACVDVNGGGAVDTSRVAQRYLAALLKYEVPVLCSIQKDEAEGSNIHIIAINKIMADIAQQYQARSGPGLI